MDNRPIGVFDSGVGGLTVVRELQKQLPAESVIYIGDTARVPYGSKAPEAILSFSRELITFLRKANVKALVAACGTISSNRFEILREENKDMPLFDVITPTVTECVNADSNSVGIIATEATIRSRVFYNLLTKSCPHMQVHMRACPLLVPIAEEGWDDELISIVVKKYIGGWIDVVDTLVLGCTHFSLLKGAIGKVLTNTRIVDMSKTVAANVRDYLIEANKANDGINPPALQLFTTGYTNAFERIACSILGDVDVKHEHL
jgi:glutamate racemase